MDIKSCRDVTIARNKAGTIIASDHSDQATGSGWIGTNASSSNVTKGGAFVFHYGAADILLEDNRTRDTCELVSIGRYDNVVENITIRRNLFVRTLDTCEGGNKEAIGLSKVSGVDVYNNTLIFPRTESGGVYPAPEADTTGIAISAGSRDSLGDPSAADVDLWNNIVDHAHNWIKYSDNWQSAINATNNFYFDRSSSSSTVSTDRIRVNTFNTSTGVASQVDKTSPAAFEASSTIAKPGYANTTEYPNECGSPASTAAHGLGATRAFSTSSNVWETTTTSPAHRGWKQDTCFTLVTTFFVCSWLTNWYGCRLPPILVYALLHFDDHGSSPSALSARQWSVTGTWAGQDGRARGESTGVALANGTLAAENEVSSIVRLLTSSATLSGVVARATSASNYYSLRLIHNEGLDLSRVNNGTRTVLASTPQVIADNVDYRLKLVVRGTNPVEVEGWIDGTQVFDYSDNSASRIQASGSAGLLSGTSNVTQFDDFEAYDPEPLAGPTSGTVLASDDFAGCVDDAAPNTSLWETSGTWYCRTQRLRGETANGLALMPGIHAYNAKMRGRVQPNSSSSNMSGVIARAVSGSYYAARLDVTNQEIALDRIDAAGTTRLDTVPYTIAVNTSYRLELSAKGWFPVQLKVFADNVSVSTVDDNSEDRIQGSTAGLLSGASTRTQFDDTFVYAE